MSTSDGDGGIEGKSQVSLLRARVGDRAAILGHSRFMQP
jgi:hypothetical protein